MAQVREAVSTALVGKTTSLALQPFFRDQHGPPMHVDLRVSPMRNDKQVVGAIIFMHDASDRYAAQKKKRLKRANGWNSSLRSGPKNWMTPSCENGRRRTFTATSRA